MSEIAIRCLAGTDLPFANQVREIAGWNQLPADWERFRALEPEGCFLAEIEGRPAGTATTTCYGRDLAWIGMVLVHPDCRRRGVGTALLGHAIEYLLRERRIGCVKLDATPEGRPLYEKLGFQAEWGLQRWWRQGVRAGQEERRDSGPGKGGLGEESLRLDQRVFGADRGGLLTLLGSGALARVTQPDGSFGLARDGARAVYLGPVTALESSSGEDLVRSLCDSLPPGREVFWDLPTGNEKAGRLARFLGFEPVRDLTRMWMGEENVASDPLRQWGIADFALG